MLYEKKEHLRYKYVLHFCNSFIPLIGYSDDLTTLDEIKKDKQIDHFYVLDTKENMIICKQ